MDELIVYCMKRLLSILMAVCLISMSAWANKTVNGRVISASDNEPLIGATVQAVGSTQGTSTDANGEFTVSVNDDVRQLTISCLGYKTQVVAIASYVSVALEEDNTLLNEVVVTAMGIKREKKSSESSPRFMPGAFSYPSTTSPLRSASMAAKTPSSELDKSTSLPT